MQYNGENSVTEYTLSSFSNFAEGVVGTIEGALGSLGFCSPTGLFDLSLNSVGPTTEIGPATVDGIATTEYAVTVDPSSFLDSPGITTAEEQAIQAAIGVLGGGPITDDLYVDAKGDVVRSVATVDGATLTVDLSDFGNATPVTLPPQQSQVVRSRSPRIVITPTTEHPGSDGTVGITTVPGNIATTTTTS
jgi:hypothetical protein